MRKKLIVFVFTACLPLMQSCLGAIQTVQMASSAFLSARAGYQGYNAVKMAKTIRESEPVFEDYQGVKVEVKLNTDNEELLKAFKDNMEWMIKKDLEIAEYEDRVVCSENCPEKTLIVQFVETGYGQTAVQKILAGEKLRGKLYYIDAKSGTVIREEPMEAASNYIDLLKEINLSVGMKALKRFEKSGDGEKLKKKVDEFNNFSPIKEEYAELFKKRG